ncbi:MAG TPA: SDR family oxidoreductase [Bacteroidota bacterium]|nr:SDR family oxidoreductase [Bacteroidota bacterium]
MLKDSVAVITGASSGIGAALARRMAGEGASVVIAARREDQLKAVAQEIARDGHRAIPVAADVTVRQEAEVIISTALEEFGRIDVLVNNAGRGHFASVEDTTDEMIRSMFALNAFALWYTTRPALVQMRKQGSGHIINVASMAGKLGYPFNSAYVAAKHACVGFTHALRMELVGTAIHATVVCPAGVLTDWASVTEGAPMLPFFSASGPVIKSLAAEQGISLPPIEGVMPADEVARQIMECIGRPVAELFTHRGSEEFLKQVAMNREEAENHQLPVVMGEQAVYENLKRPG